MLFKQTFICILFYSLCINLPASKATLSKSSKKKTTKAQEEGPISQSVFDKGLVTEAPRWKDIVANHASYYSKTRLMSTKNMVLAYVTPWNNHGYDIVKIFGGKFTHVSPVWLQLRKENGKTVITGTHDIDQGWMQEVRDAGGSVNTRIVPRLIFEGWHTQDYLELIRSKEATKSLANQILKVLDAHNLDGIVLEVWSQLPSQDLISQMPTVISHISLLMRVAGYSLILVIPPAIYQRDIPGIFSRNLFTRLVDNVDAFSLMTYDFSNFQNPGPNSPIWWVKDCIERLVPDDTDKNREKILVGLNLYGLDHSVTGGSHILGHDYIKVLKKYSPKFMYDNHSAEHFFEYKSSSGRRTVFYPTLSSIHQRLKLIKKMNCGVSLWEVGQGLDYFYDLL